MSNSQGLRSLERQEHIWQLERECGLDLSSPFYVGDTPDPARVTWMIYEARDRSARLRGSTIGLIAAVLVFLVVAADLAIGSLFNGWSSGQNTDWWPALMCGFGLVAESIAVVVLIHCSVQMVKALRG